MRYVCSKLPVKSGSISNYVRAKMKLGNWENHGEAFLHSNAFTHRGLPVTLLSVMCHCLYHECKEEGEDCFMEL